MIGDVWFEADDRVGEGGAVEGLADYLEYREDWGGERRDVVDWWPL